MYVLTERERVYAKQLGLQRESEREWEWEQQPQNERKWDELREAPGLSLDATDSFDVGDPVRGGVDVPIHDRGGASDSQ